MAPPDSPALDVPDRGRLRLRITGAVQGVGFRPFVYRLAHELRLGGIVLNDTTGVELEVEGPRSAVEEFRLRVETEAPPLARIHRVAQEWLAATGTTDFSIVASDASGDLQAFVLPDVATCADCLSEAMDPGDRRAGYAFTNCTNCGPRFSIIRALPYDRPSTTMARFLMCEDCQREYDDPADRRFHAQPNACPECGPRLGLNYGAAGAGDRELPPESQPHDDPVAAAARALNAGRIVALKGLGGFLLLVDATSEPAVARLRRRKHRPAKPLAIMVPDLDTAVALCRMNENEAVLLQSPESPIVLLEKQPESRLAEGLAPGNPRIGVMLPTSPLHHLIARAFGGPLVATSGNLSDEPICTDNDEALERLGEIADAFIVHDRPIARHVDDSVQWVLDRAPQTLRRARGLAPMPVLLAHSLPDALAVGAHLKNSVALAMGDRAFISQHIGDMETPEALSAFAAVIGDFIDLYRAEPRAIAHDLHPDYASTQWAEDAVSGTSGMPGALAGLPLVPVQHHHAHLASCLAEHQIREPVLGAIWDGTGLGTDGTIWGGEFLLGDASGYVRVARLRPFALPGGDAATRDPRRPALSLLHALGAADANSLARLPALQQQLGEDADLLRNMLDGGFNSPLTSSAGRLFDAVAAILGLCDGVSYEGEAAMRLEFACAPGPSGDYRFGIEPVASPEAPDAPRVGERVEPTLLEIDWRPVIEAVVEDAAAGTPTAAIASGFHDALVDLIARVCRRTGSTRVALSGGCFQNRRLQEAALDLLPQQGLEVLVQRQVPPNDGGISLGQVVVAATRMQRAGTQVPGRKEN